eukprot:Gb_32012 [translate_table: standard]
MRGDFLSAMFVLMAIVICACPTYATLQTVNKVAGSSVDLWANYTSWEDLNVEPLDSQVQMLSWYNHNRKVLIVAKDGSGHSRTVQGAVDLVPHGNRQRVKILIRAGIYREKVVVPPTKAFVSFIGQGSAVTIVTWNSRASDKGPNGQVLGTFASASVAIESDYFCARDITFQVTYSSLRDDPSLQAALIIHFVHAPCGVDDHNTAPSPLPGAEGMQAVALRVSGDKAVFMNCRMVGCQDTLFDHIGRHYFWNCYIEGSIDFVFGNGRSLYQGCVLHANAASYGAIAASQRNSPRENTGFAFLFCKLTGSGILYLGRAWGRYARIVYAFCHFDNIIIPQGWYDWGDPSRRRTVWFGEYKCSGEGANSQGRVSWTRRLSYDDVKPFLDRKFIDGEEWLRI